MLEFTLEELIARTGATRRNIKYWTALYALPFRREGRRNYYPEATERLLRGIALLSDHPILTTSYIRWMVDETLGRPAGNRARAAALAGGWNSVAAAFGETGLLPAALPEFLSKVLPPVPALSSAADARPIDHVPVRSIRKRDDDALL